MKINQRFLVLLMKNLYDGSMFFVNKGLFSGALGFFYSLLDKRAEPFWINSNLAIPCKLNAFSYSKGIKFVQQKSVTLLDKNLYIHSTSKKHPWNYLIGPL